jgi:hypothetical protein
MLALAACGGAATRPTASTPAPAPAALPIAAAPTCAAPGGGDAARNLRGWMTAAPWCQTVDGSRQCLRFAKDGRVTLVTRMPQQPVLVLTFPMSGPSQIELPIRQGCWRVAPTGAEVALGSPRFVPAAVSGLASPAPRLDHAIGLVYGPRLELDGQHYQLTIDLPQMPGSFTAGL